MLKFISWGCTGMLLVIGAVGIGGMVIGGYRLSDPELEMQKDWVHAFRTDAPDLSKQIARGCVNEIGRSPWTRDGAFALFSCIREEAEEQGYEYEWTEEQVAEYYGNAG